MLRPLLTCLSFGKRMMMLSALVLQLAVPIAASAGAIEYVYDDLGRVIAAVESGANRTNYSYDANSNVLTVSTVPASQVAVLNFLPKQGAVGTTVTVYGSGFSTTPSSNTVKVNGTAAIVSAATLTSLTLIVPACSRKRNDRSNCSNDTDWDSDE
jgi:YD repeat-containing protein